MSSLPASIERIGSKTTEKRWRHRFPHYKSMGAFCCHGNQSFDPIFPKTLCSLSPTPVMLHIKFDQDWPTGFRDIQVWKCGRRTTYDDGRQTTDDGRRTDDGPLVYYKLTLWAFGSGELKMCQLFFHEKSIYEISLACMVHIDMACMWPMDRHAETDNPNPICPLNFFKVGGIKMFCLVWKHRILLAEYYITTPTQPNFFNANPK